MAFRRSDLQEAFFVPGTYAFRVYSYGTTDPLEAVLAPGYFQHGSGLLRPGDLIYVSLGASETRSTAAPDEPRKALVMMRADERDPARAWLLGPTTKVGPEQRGCRTSAARAIQQARF